MTSWGALNSFLQGRCLTSEVPEIGGLMAGRDAPRTLEHLQNLEKDVQQGCELIEKKYKSSTSKY